MTRRLIVFTRYPEAGRAKTRLIPLLGAHGAAELSRRLTQQTLDWAGTLVDTGVELEIWFDGGDVAGMKACFGPRMRYRPQPAGDLGERLVAALDGIEQPTIVIGTDCPDLGPQRVCQAFAALASNDVVLGPASDGGYYLVGMKHSTPALFTGIPWGSAEVWRATQKIADDLRLSVAVLDILADLDRPEDLHLLNR